MYEFILFVFLKSFWKEGLGIRCGVYFGFLLNQNEIAMVMLGGRIFLQKYNGKNIITEKYFEFFCI
jgi:hypothetical protein